MAKSSKSGQIRIIGGEYGSRRLQFKLVEGLRPTPDKIRETLFNWLQEDVRGARCLDLFAGTGALGIEALSRGAAHVTFVEASRQVCRGLQQNLDTLGAAGAEVHCVRADKFLESATQKFDIVFIDPPYDKNYTATALEKLRTNELLSPGARIYLEHRRGDRDAEPDSAWTILRQSHCGEVMGYLLCTK